MAMMQTTTASVVMMEGITISNSDDADTDNERGGEGGDHYQQGR